MSCKQFLFICVTIVCLKFAEVFGQAVQKSKFPSTRFTCTGKASGYYADIDTGCQVYHMCDGLGRQFSYKCPNMTLFQQRMLICDHWYMVNCSMSERDYDANLLIGQRDKPFVSDDEMRLRTPRPDILSVPPYNPYFDILRTDAKLPDVDNNDLDTRPSQHPIRPSFRPEDINNNRRQDTIAKLGPKNDNLDQAASQGPEPTFTPTPSTQLQNNGQRPKIAPPFQELLPPAPPKDDGQDYSNTTQDESVVAKDPVFQFIKRFDPNSPDVDIHQTAMSKSEILDINAQLPEGQVSSEEDRAPRKHKNFGNNFNTLKSDNDKSFSERTRFDSVNTKSKPTEETRVVQSSIPEPEKELLPPKTSSDPIISTTVGPPIYYEWRWAVPAFDLIPPKENNETNTTNIQQTRSVAKFEGKNPFSTVTRPAPVTTTPEPSLVEYNISSYFVPDYIFPLDNEHPGYENEDAQTSFQVKIATSGRQSYGENPECPQCHPAYLNPGTCEPCIVKR